jgi:hypothetical protein
MRGLSYTDGLVLGIRHQDGSRFEILRNIGSLQTPLSLTVITTHVDDTRRLQAAWASQTEIACAIRVITTYDAPERPDHVMLVGMGSEDLLRPRRYRSELWTGFTQIEAKSNTPKPHPWALVVCTANGLTTVG